MDAQIDRQPDAKVESPSVSNRQLTSAEEEALAMRQLFVPSCLAAIVQETEVTRRGAMVFVRAFLSEAGDPSDPIERVLIEQLIMAHHRLGKLHVQADAAKAPESQKVLNTAAARLLAEIRRMALAIRQYRQPVSPRQFNVVHQQNIATGAKQDVTYIDRSSPAGSDVSFSSRSELRDKTPGDQPHENSHGDTRTTSDREIPGTRGRWQDQRLQAASVER